MSAEQIEAEYWEMRDQYGDAPCTVCHGAESEEYDGCSDCEYSGLEGIRLCGYSPFDDVDGEDDA